MPLTFDSVTVPLRIDQADTIRVSGTRVTLDTVIAAHLAGDSPERIAQGYPPLPLADIYTTIAWYSQHHARAGTYLQERAEEGAA